MAPFPASRLRARTTSAWAGVVRRFGASRRTQEGGRGGALSGPPGHTIRRVSRVDVSISYEPQSDGKPDPGEVIWVWIPYEEDSTLGKDRPAGRGVRREGATLPKPVFDEIICALTRNSASLGSPRRVAHAGDTEATLLG